jgi:hypothetical protein
MDQQLERKRISQRLLIDVLVIVISLVIIGIAIGFGIGVQVAPLVTYPVAGYANS